jgi:DNA-binding response OmpR family regulator
VAKRSMPKPVFVLIAEDDPTIAELIAVVVEQSGATPLTASDGRQALRLAHAYPPKVVITDLMMPVMRGDSLIAALRLEWGSRIPVILMSACPHSEMLKAGADALLAKPFAIEELQELLEYYLAVRPAARRIVPMIQPNAQSAGLYGLLSR